MLEFVFPLNPSDYRSAIKLAHCERCLCGFKDQFDVTVDFIFSRATKK